MELGREGVKLVGKEEEQCLGKLQEGADLAAMACAVLLTHSLFASFLSSVMIQSKEICLVSVNTFVFCEFCFPAGNTEAKGYYFVKS